MSDEGEIHVPGVTPRYKLPDQEQASVRPGPTAPQPDHGAVCFDATTILDAIRQARGLFRVARHPTTDPLYPHLRPLLLQGEAWLQRQLRDDPQDTAAAVLLQEVRRYLGRQHP